MKRVMMSWSSGKDSAWALSRVLQDPEIELAGLFCTVNGEFDRVAMHGVRVDLLMKQAESVGLPMELIEIPSPCSNEEYNRIMSGFVEKAKLGNVDCFAFGDLFLEDVRRYRESNLDGCGIEPIFPIWGLSTRELSREMIKGGLKAVITCVDPKQVPENIVGAEFNAGLLDSLPESVDPCGENGEFHTFVYDGPMFEFPIDVSVGEIVHRDGFVFADIF